MSNNFFIKLAITLLAAFIIWLVYTTSHNQTRIAVLEEWRGHIEDIVHKSEEDIEDLEDATANP